MMTHKLVERQRSVMFEAARWPQLTVADSLLSQCHAIRAGLVLELRKVVAGDESMSSRMDAIDADGTLFHLGTLLITPKAADVIPLTCVMLGFEAHHAGDWGDVEPESVAMNREALRNGCGEIWSIPMVDNQICSCRFYVVTECDHRATTVLLTEEW